MVMPYVSGETLQSVIERQGQLPLSLVANYLDRLSNALDYAHKQGIPHLNLKPGNVFLTNGEHLLLSDFGLTKIVIERQTSQMRMLRAGRPVGSLDYMAPEQIMGDVVDARTDLYSLGVLLYQVVTGKTPFQIGTPQQIASQVLQAPSSSPHVLRNDLPQVAEQVILQALAKRPLDRHPSAQDLARAFRVALTPAGSLAEPSSSTIAGVASAAPLSTPRKRGLFDPVWQQAAREEEQVRPVTSNQSSNKSTGLLTAEGLAAFRSSNNLAPVDTREPDKVPDVPTFPETPLPPTRSRSGFKSSGLLPMNGSESAPKQVSPSAGVAPNLTKPLTTSNNEQPTTRALPITNPISPLQATNTTGTLTLPGEMGANGTMKLTGAVKLVQVPVAGQPGRYVTGFLPVSPGTPGTEKPEASSNKPANDPLAPQYVKLLERLCTPQNANLLQKFWAPLLAFFIILAGLWMFFCFYSDPLSRSMNRVVYEKQQ